MTNTEKFFVECVKKGIKEETVECVPEYLDYKRFYNLCTSHSMSVVVFKALQRVTDALDPQFLEALQNFVYCHVVLDVQSEYDINNVLRALEERGLKYMPLKGYHLKNIYPSTDMRYSSDCDILIDVDQLKQVRALVDELGLSTERHDEHHDIVYFPQTKTVFELHKTIFIGPLEEYFGKENKGFDRARVKDGYKYFYEMDSELFYVSILAHSAYHFAQSAGVGIRHLTDIYLYRKTYPLNEERLDAELRKCGLLNFKNEFEKLAAYWFDNAEADEFTEKLGKHVLKSSLLANSELKSASDLAVQLHSAKVDEKKAKKLSFWRAIFPVKEHMKFSYPVLKKHSWLLPIFYAVRWFHIVFTRPRSISNLKKMTNVATEDLNYMMEIRGGLDINHL